MKKILIIEDDPDLGMLYQMILASDGYEVKHVMHAFKMMSSSINFPADLILLDQHLSASDISGIRLFPFLKKYFRCPVLILSNSSSPELRKRAFELGAIDVLLKIDYSPDQLRQYINKLLK